MNSEQAALVSVVVPTHNQCRFLFEAVESAQGQTYQPIEVVVVDSGSTDDTPALLDQLEGSATIVRTHNVGPSAARNLGVKHARGEVIVFVDGDDLLAPSCVEARLQLLRRFPASEVVVGALRVVEASGRALFEEGLGLESGALLDYEMMLETMFGPTCGLMVTRAAYEEMGGFDESFMIAEDSEFVVRASRRAPLIYDAEARADYRQAGASLSRRWVLWYDSYRRLVSQLAQADPDQARFWRIVRPAFSDRVSNMMFAKPLKDGGMKGVPILLRSLVLRPSLIPFLGYWLKRYLQNRFKVARHSPT